MSRQAIFKQIDIWKKRDEKTLLRYRILQEIESDKFYVITVDILDRSLKLKDLQKLEREYWFIDRLLFCEPPNERGPGYESVEKAIEAFDQDS